MDRVRSFRGPAQYKQARKLERREFAHGCCQVQWLRIKGWRFEVNGNRRPIVARKYAEKMLGCGVPEQRAYAPNFASLQAR